jgi:hypothetical protein
VYIDPWVYFRMGHPAHVPLAYRPRGLDLWALHLLSGLVDIVGGQAELYGYDDRLDAIRGPELRHEVKHVVLYGAGADKEALCDLLIGLPSHQKPGHLLPRCEWFPKRRWHWPLT